MKTTTILLFILVIPTVTFSQTWYEEILDSLYGNNILNTPDHYSHDTCIFKNHCNIINIDTSASNLWQIGQPLKNYFDTAYIGTKSLLTDTINPYPAGNYSVFEIDMNDFSKLGFGAIYILEFTHKIDTDTLKDGGIIEIFYDYNIGWENILDTTEGWSVINYYNYNMYKESDTLFNGEKGFSGKNDWITSGVIFDTYQDCCSGDNLKFRFTFISDSIDNPKDGWMIDNVKIHEHAWIWSVKEIFKSKNPLKVYPNPATNSVTVELDDDNNKIYDAHLFDLAGKKVRELKGLSGDSFNIDRGELKSGAYHVFIQQNGTALGMGKIVFE